ncbi:MAG: NAD-dependent epimerase/dehydratase family protein [Verrucomicrobiales bacterium]|nr:NAD-dependent epimerase/dehydratase family protein [Verrucomicrobiales bacterium]
MAGVLIFGSRGFIGRRLISDLEGVGEFSMHTPFEGDVDITNYEEVERYVKSIQPDFILNLAAASIPSDTDFSKFYLVNILGARNILQAVDTVIRDCKVLLFSSAHVYGLASGLLSEAQPVSPVSDYGISKAAMEMLPALFPAVEVSVVRPFNLIGRGQNPSLFLAKVIRHCIEEQPVLEVGDLALKRDFLDVRDASTAICKLLTLPRWAQGPVNICSGVSLGLGSLIEATCEVTGWTPEIKSVERFKRSTDAPVIRGDNRRLRSLIDWEPRFDLRDTLNWAVDCPPA